MKRAKIIGEVKGKIRTQTQLQYVSDESGAAVGVIVPIALWREIEAQRESCGWPTIASKDDKRSAEIKRRLDALDRLEKAATGCEVDDSRASIYGERGL